MGKKVSLRNFVGGFLGGMFGILSSWYIDPAMIPVGVFLGVLIGWWNVYIVNLFGEAHRQARKIAASFIGAIDYVIPTFTRFRKLSSKIIGIFRWAITKKVVKIIALAISAPIRFIRWLACHPINRADFINTTMLLIFIFGIPTITFFLEPHLGIEESGNRGILVILSLVIAMGGSMIYQMRYEVTKNDDLNRLRRFYRELEIISHYGSLGFFIYTMTMQIRYIIGFALFFAIAIPWLFVILVAGFLSCYLLFFIISISYGFYKIANLYSHWLCLGVTMTVTSILWFVYNESFSDPRMLWMIAFGAGIISGATTELIHQIMTALFKNTAAEKGSVWDLFIKDDGSNYIFDIVICKFGCMWFRQNRVARKFRKLCFRTESYEF